MSADALATPFAAVRLSPLPVRSVDVPAIPSDCLLTPCDHVRPWDGVPLRRSASPAVSSLAAVVGLLPLPRPDVTATLAPPAPPVQPV